MRLLMGSVTNSVLALKGPGVGPIASVCKDWRELSEAASRDQDRREVDDPYRRVKQSFGAARGGIASQTEAHDLNLAGPRKVSVPTHLARYY